MSQWYKNNWILPSCDFSILILHPNRSNNQNDLDLPFERLLYIATLFSSFKTSECVEFALQRILKYFTGCPVMRASLLLCAVTNSYNGKNNITLQREEVRKQEVYICVYVHAIEVSDHERVSETR